MSNIQLDYSDIMDIFKEKLKIDNIVKKVSSIFLNQRYAGKINYKPYFQRNYVWDEEKATYFIESILLGTEIPPLVLFQTKDKNEVIDGRQRYETIKRFLEDKLVLKDKGLHSLKVLAGKRYSQLDSDTKELFEDTRIRILQFNVVDEPKLDEEKDKIELVFDYISNASGNHKLWDNIINNPQRSVEQISHYKINKPLPETLTIEDIISDMKKSRFLIRPDYQRSEVKNLQKASYLMESILLGINIPPLFIYKKKDRIKEVVDGQQRLLTILGFLGKTYINERGESVCSDKDKFKLSKLKILSELNGKTIDTIDDEFEEKILEFPMDIIEIDSEQNPDFSQIDLFLRLNTKPYPIKENTFEMWNAYIDKDIVIKVKEIAIRYEKKVFRGRDTRMKLEELITSLAYIDYRMNQPHTEIINVLNIYKRNDRMCARIMSKDNVTKTLSDLSNSNPKVFVKALENVEIFVDKILMLIENNPEQLRALFNHSNKGIQYKTDQNFYFLWAILFEISVEELQNNRQEEFKRISRIFSSIQKTPADYTTEKFLNELK